VQGQPSPLHKQIIPEYQFPEAQSLFELHFFASISFVKLAFIWLAVGMVEVAIRSLHKKNAMKTNNLVIFIQPPISNPLLFINV